MNPGAGTNAGTSTGTDTDTDANAGTDACADAGADTNTDTETESLRNDEQAELWNGIAGRGWVEAQEVMDDLLRPFENRLLEELAVVMDESPVRTLLDVGCGTGSTTMAAARRIGTGGRCVGVDISEPMLNHARFRAQAQAKDLAIEFVHADAQEHALQKDFYDQIISRFGVMFFADSIKAFANLRSGIKSGGRLAFVAWRSPQENPFMTVPVKAAAQFVEIPPTPPNAPGQFGFADSKWVEHILKQSGWVDVEIDPFDTTCSMPSQNLRDFLNNVGPVSRLLPDVDDCKKQQIIDATIEALESYRKDSEISFDAACWLVRARA